MKKQKPKASLILFAVFALVAGLCFGVVALTLSAVSLKNKLSAQGSSALNELSLGQQALAQKDFASAQNHFSTALNNFTQAQQTLRHSNIILRAAIDILPKIKTAKNALAAGIQISQAGQHLTNFYNLAQQIKISPQGIEVTGNSTSTLPNLNAEITAAAQNAELAVTNLKNVDPSLVPASKREQFIEAKDKLDEAENLISGGQKLFSALGNIIIPQSTVLVMFENNNELRPGGGFMGTYGKFVVQNGKIQSMTISSIYDLDGQLTKKISPPTPMLAVNNRWYLRDSNWFASWPESAAKISQFYEMEGGETPSAILALTPTFVSQMLQVTGPITVSTFGVTLTPDNFIEQTQAISTISDNSPLNKPKQILADFFPLFLQKLQTLSLDQYKQLLAVVLQNLQSKQIVLFAQNSQTEKSFLDFNWGGAVAQTDEDYLQVVSSNLGGTKTDLYLNKNIDFKTTVTKDGEVLDDLTMTVTNTLPGIHDSQNTSFVRFLVPKGSEVLVANGFEQKNYDSDVNSSFARDPEAAAWQQSIAVDSATKMMVGEESGKTFFANWLTVGGGESKTVRLIYKLPFTLKTQDKLSLLLQKQIGSVNEQFTYTVNFAGKEVQYISYKPDKQDSSSASITKPIDQDYLFGLVLRNH